MFDIIKPFTDALLTNRTRRRLQRTTRPDILETLFEIEGTSTFRQIIWIKQENYCENL